MNKHLNRKRKFAFFICLLLLASILLSMTYIAKEANHICIGDNCPICANIQMAEKTIGQLGTTLAIALHLGFAFAIFCLFLFYFITDKVLPTPVTQNVRMNN